MNKYTGTIVEESLDDNRLINEFNILNTRISGAENPADRWHLYKVDATKEQLEELSKHIKPQKWYAHFWCDDEMIVVFRDKMFDQKVNDKNTWEPAIRYGLSHGIPIKQLDFVVE
ncbi:MAG: hypothetical protein WC773_04255 [Patescibacteria group bacterium]|jgi:hypothetical protein